MHASRSLLFLGLLALSLAGCGDVRESLGLGRTSPDEFAVIDRPPLAMPPDFGLRPPDPGAPRPQEVDMTQRADEVLFGAKTEAGATTSSPATSADESDSEKALLVSAGGDKADPNIRSMINRESSERSSAPVHLLQDLMWWKKDQPPGAVVDATAEAARIKEVKDKGEPINQGATPIIEKQKSSWLGL